MARSGTLLRALGLVVALALWGAGTASAAGSASQTAPSLAGYLGKNGELVLPPGFSGSLDPSGFRIVSSEGEPLRFTPIDAKAGQVDDRWSGTGTVGNGCNADVLALAIDGGGRLYVGGAFTQCGDVAARFVAVFDTVSNTWSPLGNGAANGVSDHVRTLAISGSEVYVGGSFTRAGGMAANRVARFNTTTGSWSALGSGVANGVSGCRSDGLACVRSLAVAGSDVYVGGSFSQAGGAPANRVARFDTTTGTWFTLGIGAANGVLPSPSTVMALAVAGNDVYVGGEFSEAGGVPANNVARFNITTQTWSPLGSGAANGLNNYASALAIVGSDVYVGGWFNVAGGVPANKIARFNTATQTWSPLGSGAANGVSGNVISAFAIVGTDLYVGGDFRVAGGVAVNRVARFSTTNQIWSPLGSGAANGVSLPPFALAVVGDNVYVGGYFTQAGGAMANSVARFGTSTQSWSALGSGAATGVNRVGTAVAIAGGDVYFGGGFTQASGATANSVARFNTTTQTWSPLGSGAANGVRGGPQALAIVGSDVYVGGTFDRAGGAMATNVARFDISTQSWSALGSGAGSGVNWSVYALAIAGNNVYVGGDFTEAGGVAASRVARFNTTTQTWFSLGSGAANGVNGRVFALAIAGDDVYVGGSFTQAGGATANNVARFSTSSQTWFALGTGGANGVGGCNANCVRALVVGDGGVYVGGSLTQAGGAAANRVARFDIATQTWSPLGSGTVNGLNNWVLALAIAGSDVYVGGRFTEAGGAAANRVARFSITAQRWFPLGGGVPAGEVLALALGSNELAASGKFGEAGSTVTSTAALYRVGAPTTVTLSIPSTAMASRPALAGTTVSGSLGAPTGVVRVLASTGESCVATAPEGSCSITFTTGGARTMTAVYDGDGDYEANASADLAVAAGSGSTVVFTVTVSLDDRVFASGFEQP